MKENKFVHVHTHSVYSVRDGMLKINDIIDFSIANNEAVALTDHGSIGGWVEYYNAAKKNNIKPIFGVEIYINQYRNELFDVLKQLADNHLADDDRKILSQRRDELRKHQRHLVLLAKNETGFYNIIKIMNEAYVDWFYNKPLLDYNTLFSISKKGDAGIVVTSACLASPLNHINDDEAVFEFVELMQTHFGKDFYLEVQINDIKEQRAFNKKIIKFAEKTDTKIVIGSDSHYLTHKDADTHQDLLLLQDKNVRSDLGKSDIRVKFENKKGETKSKKVQPGKEFRKGFLVDDLKVGQKIGHDVIIDIESVNRVWSYSTTMLWLRTEADMRKDCPKYHKELVPIIDDIIKSNYEIYSKIENITLNTDIKLPKIDNASKRFVELIKEGIRNKGFKERKYVERAKYEMNVIKQFGFETYFLILHDLMQWSRENNIGTGAGRGSCAGSFVAYLLDIHRINPFDERWDTEGDGLPFERFLDFSKLFAKIIVESGSKKLEFMEYDDVKINRDGNIITVKASELQEGDEIS